MIKHVMQSNRYSWPILIKLEFSPQVVEKCQHIKRHANPTCGSLVVPWGEKDRGGDMMKLVVAFRNFANAPNNALKYVHLGSTLNMVGCDLI